MNLLDYACAALSFALVACLTLHLYEVAARKVHGFLLRRRLQAGPERFRGLRGVAIAERSSSSSGAGEASSGARRPARR